MRSLRVAALFVPILAGCVTRMPVPSLAACDSQIANGGGRIIEMPQNAPALREIADRNTHVFPEVPLFQTEVWAALSNGDLVLCRANSYKGHYVEGEMWRFDSIDHGIQLIDHVSWVVQHDSVRPPNTSLERARER